MNEKTRFKGQTALVTGGTRGIGRAVAVELARGGADVAVNFFSNRSAAASTVEELRSLGSDAESFRANVGNTEHLERLFAQVGERFGHLDMFVSNAATGTLRPAIELEAKDWERSMDTNTRSFLSGARLALPLMEGRGGRILAMTSMGSRRVIPNYAAVGAAKAALEALVRYLAVELAPHDVRVNALAAGVVDTDSLKLFPNREDLLRQTKNETPLGRMGMPEDIARAAVMLLGRDAAWITGQVIVADGGHSLLV